MFLPEASDYIGSSPAETISLAKSVADSEFVQGLQADARKYQLPINVGIHEPVQGGDKVKNTLIWIDEQGGITQRYQKLHLFDVEIKDGPVLRESKLSSPMTIHSCFVPPFADVPVAYPVDLLKQKATYEANVLAPKGVWRKGNT